jgi:RNA polymerase sigma factor (sigma-70 family)
MCLSDHPDLNFMVWAALKHYKNLATVTGLSREDLLHEVKTHIFLYTNSIGEVSATTVVFNCTKWALINYLDRTRLKEQRLCEEVTPPTIRDSEPGHIDRGPFSELVRSLPENQRTILTMRFVGAKTFGEIGQELDLSKQRIEQIFRGALKALKKELENEN